MLARNRIRTTATVRTKSMTALAACTIIACLSFSWSAVAQTTGACRNGLCSEGFTEADCLAGGGRPVWVP